MKPKPTKRARIVVADDHPLYRRGLAAFLNEQPKTVCCACVGTVPELSKAMDEATPDLAIVDLRFANGEGLKVIENLKTSHAHVPVLVMSQADEMIHAERVLRAGANGYIMKDKAADEVMFAIETVLSGSIYASRRLMETVLQKVVAGRQQPAREGIVGVLSEREREVFYSIGRGQGTRNIAEGLKLSIKTVETYREKIKRKLSLRDAAELRRAANEWVLAGGKFDGEQAGV